MARRFAALSSLVALGACGLYWTVANLLGLVGIGGNPGDGAGYDQPAVTVQRPAEQPEPVEPPVQEKPEPQTSDSPNVITVHVRGDKLFMADQEVTAAWVTEKAVAQQARVTIIRAETATARAREELVELLMKRRVPYRLQ